MEDKNINYISLTEAAKSCDYSQDYLSLRARQGKLGAVKIGRNWVTTKEWLEEYINNINGYGVIERENVKASIESVAGVPAGSYDSSEAGGAKFLSLHKAAEICGYSQEYLSLRARQGKLKAIKMGRNWVTKKEWLADYVVNFNGAVPHTHTEVDEEPIEQEQSITEQIRQELRMAQAEIGEQAVVSKAQLQKSPRLRKMPRIKLPSIAFPSFLGRKPAYIAVCVLVLVAVVFGFGSDRIANLAIRTGESIKSAGLSIVRTAVTVPEEYIGYTIREEVDIEQEVKVFQTTKISAKKHFRFVSETMETARQGASMFLEGLVEIPGHFKFFASKDIRFLELFMKKKAQDAGANLVKSGSVFLKAVSGSVEKVGLTIGKAVDTLINLDILQLSKVKESISGFIAFSFESIKTRDNEIKESIFSSFEFLEHKTKSFISSALKAVESTSYNAMKNFSIVRKEFTARIGDANKEAKGFFAGIKTVAESLTDKMARPLHILVDALKTIPSKIAGIFGRKSEQEIVQQPSEKPGKREGMVVVPSTDKDDEIKAQIQKSFSDEVRVEPKDDGSGIITPVFRNKEGGDYMYIMVPMDVE